MKAEDIVRLRREFHQIPELGYKEFETSSRIAAYLRGWGLEVHTGVARTGVLGVLRGEGGPALCYRADIDALPISELNDVEYASRNGCMHACGHDAHLAIGLALAKSYSERGRLSRDLVFLFQPNEEGAPGIGPAGAQLMVEEGVLERFGIGQVLALHCEPDLELGRIGVKSGAMWAASVRFVVDILGESSHGAYPERGRDALRAGAAAVVELYERLSEVLGQDERFSICRFDAGVAFNVIAGASRLEGLLRARSFEATDAIAVHIRELLARISQRYRVQFNLELHRGADAVINDTALSERVHAVLEAAGLAQKVQMRVGAEDFSEFSSRVPSYYALLGVKPRDIAQMPPLHSPYFSIDERALAIGHRAMILLIDDLLSH